MISKIFNKNIFSLLSFLSAFLGLTLFFIYRSFPGYSNVSQDLGKDMILLFLTIFSLLFFLISNLKRKSVIISDNKNVRLLFILLPIFVLLSCLFSGEFSNSFFGKYTFLQSGLTYLSIIILVYIVSLSLKKYKALAWFLFFISNLIITLPTIIALILSKFGFLTFSNKLVSFVDNWDTVALVSGIIIIIGLIYYEIIAKTRNQKIISISVVAIHLLLIICIVMPDIWYSLLLSSLLIFLINKNQIVFYKKLSFYLGIISLLFSIFYILSTISPSNFSNILNKYIVYSNKYSGVNYTFIKPKLGLSLELGLKEIKKGHLFGTGPNEFYKAWQANKPQGVIDSIYWSQIFTSSYSSLTTMMVSLGILGIGILILISVSIILRFKNKLRSIADDDSYKFNEENRFYLYSSFILYIFSLSIFLFFTNSVNAFVLLAISTAFALSVLFSYKESAKFKFNLFIFIILIIFLLLSTKVIFKKARASKLVNISLSNYNKDNNADILESNLLKALNIDKSDVNYRLLANFYLLKTQNTLSQINASTNKDTFTDIQKNSSNYINKAISFANSAVSKDKKDYNNYLTLGSIYTLLMNASTQNKEANYNLAKEAYTTALSLYPKNPAIYLTLAQLQYDYNQDASSTKINLDKSLEIKPNYSDAFFTYSQLSLLNNDRDSAEKYLLQSIQSDPNNVNAYMQYGILMLNSQNLTSEVLNKAYTAFMSILQIDSNNLTAGYYLGVTYILAKDYDKASNVVSVLEKALPSDPKVAELANFLKNSQSGQKESTEIKTTKEVKNK